MKKFLMLSIGCLFLDFSIWGQIIQPGTTDEDYLRLEQLDKGSSLLNTPSAYYAKDSLSFLEFPQKKFSVLPVYSTSAFNSGYARSLNDGTLWTGRGFTQAISLGGQYDGKYLKITFNPMMYYSQNRGFNLGSGNNTTEYNYQYTIGGGENGLDWIQRYGDKSFVFFNLGQSEIAFNYKKVGLSITTQNYSNGPARFYPILQSKNGVGFPRIEFGTIEPVPLHIGKIDLGSIEIRGEYGYLTASEYADDSNERFDRFLAGLNIEYTVPYIKGVKLGLIKSLIKNMDAFEWYDLLSPIYRVDQDDFDDLVANDNYDQLASVYIDWYLSDPKLRLYFVYSKNDFFYNPGQILQELEHSAGRVLGLEKIFELNNSNRLHMIFEHTNIIRSNSYMHRPTPPYYVHSIVKQGYTHQGQLLGAGFGPGGAAENLAINFFSNDKMIGIRMERIRYNEDYFNAVLDVPWEDEKEYYHDVEYTLELNCRKDFGQMSISGKLAYSHRFNMYFDPANDVDNLFTKVNATWYF